MSICVTYKTKTYRIKVRSDRHRGVLSPFRLFWAQSYAPWLLVGLMLVITYYLAINQIYNIVGGIQ